MLNTPILFLVFNRPDTTRQVFAKIREIQPKQLFIAADGAREGKEGEQEKVHEVRKLILEGIDWDCEVKTLFRDKNLGCGKAVSEGITWFFENVEQGIILEDDCLPESSFFPFCEKMLEKYKYNQKILMITGTNYLFGLQKEDVDYYYSSLCAIWGWATWRRAWELHNSKIQNIDRKRIKEKYINQYFVNFIYKMIRSTIEDDLDTWDSLWLYNFIIHNGLSITPIKNQIKNLGYNGAHANNDTSPFINMPTEIITHIENLKSSNKISPNNYLDKIAIKNIVKGDKLKISFYQKIKLSLSNQKLRVKSYVLKFSKKDKKKTS
ncbi:MAG: nucleotide-diphospho-sugar transferase [Thermonemataceae bacterium]|nr:nucleotide-diphospho-sugar transferase [Thermonemataceae bacterium]